MNETYLIIDIIAIVGLFITAIITQKQKEI